MSTLRTMNGVSYLIPDQGDTFIWGIDLSGWVGATSNGTLQKTGGAFTLSADADFGPNFGLKASYFTSRGSAATAGLVRLANTDTIQFRNAAGTGNNILSMSGDTLTYSGTFSAGTYANINANSLTGTTLASNVVASSLTSVGTLSTLTVSGSITSNSGLSLPASNAGIEIGANTATNTPFIDFHSQNAPRDYDVRLIAGGGGASDGQGTLTLQAAAFNTGAKVGLVNGGTGVAAASALYVTGDITAARNSTTGVIFLSQSGNEYLYFNGSNYQFGASGGGATISPGGAVTATNHIGPGTGLTGTAGSLNIGGNAVTVTSAAGRTDSAAYPVVWNTTGGTSQNYSCTAVNIQSSTGTLNATTLAANGLNSTVQSNFQGSQTTGIGTATGGLGGAMVQGNGTNAAFMCFHRPASYAAYFGLDTDNQWKVGGWSAGANAYTLYHSGNITISPTAGVASRVVQADASGYINNTYFNGSDEGTSGTAGTVTGILTKRGDNYYRTTNAASVAAYVGPSITSLGNIATMNGVSPANGAIRMTPNMHLNPGAGSAVICAWDNGNGGNSANQAVRVGNGSGTDSFYVTYAGNVTAAADITAYSDIRVKTNIEVIPDALAKVEQVRGVTFNRTDNKEDTRRHTGVIAQELEVVLPEAIHETESGMKTVAYGNVVGLLIEAIKELNAEVKALKALVRGA